MFFLSEACYHFPQGINQLLLQMELSSVVQFFCYDLSIKYMKVYHIAGLQSIIRNQIEWFIRRLNDNLEYFPANFIQNIINMKLARITILLIGILCGISSQSGCPSIPNCQVCPTPTFCFRCNTFYILVGRGCQLSKQKISRVLVQITQSEIPGPNINMLQGQQQENMKVELGIIRFGSTGFSIASPCMLQWKGVCIMCSGGYKMGQGGVCIERFQKCIKYQGLMCSQCDTRFSTESGQCIDRGCLNKNYYHCTTCKPGYRLNKYQHCQIPRCISYKQGICQKCQNNNLLLNEACFKKIQNCKNQTTLGCTQCNQGYFLFENQCKMTSPTCNRYQAQTGKCAECKYRQLSLVNGNCVDNYCLDNDPKGRCTVCSVGYKMNDDRVCISTFQDPHCRQVNLKSCIQCEDGYYVGGEGKCVQLPANCIQATCKYCKKGYISYNKSCIPLTNCDKFSGNACISCVNGYSLTLLGTCIKTVPSCMEYSLTGCSKCPQNFSLQNQTCIFNTSFLDPNCNARSIKRQCILCKSGYKLTKKYNNLCTKISIQCKSTKGNGQCQSCYDGYKLNSYTGDCDLAASIQNCAVQANSICQLCSNRYYLVNSITCQQVDPLCRDYEKDLGYCLSCYEGYHLIANSCQSLATLVRTVPSAPASSGQTSTSISNCRILDPKNITRCYTCFNGFYVDIVSGNCVKINNLCKTVNSDGSCETCFDGYEPKDKTCKPSSTTITNSNLGCRKLNPLTKVCDQCVDRYIKSGSSCVEVSPLCNEYDLISGACTSCYMGYILFQTQCVEDHIQNCEQISQNDPTVCNKCIDGYYSKNNTCEKVSILCGKANYKGECITCIDGYFRNSENACITPALGWDSGCAKYDDSGYCIQCKQGQKLNNFLCV